MTDKRTILLIRPENIYHYNNYPPLGLICLGSKLKEAGFSVVIINSSFEKSILKTLEKYLARDILLIGISLLTSEAADAYRIIQFVKERSNVPIVAGGWHCTLFPEQMAAFESVDYVIAGEGEEHLIALAQQLSLGLRPDRKVFSKKMIDMETLPFPDYSLDTNIENFVSSYLTDKLSERVIQPMRWLPYESSRGCPSQCTFCINVVTDNTRYRRKSAAKVISEVEAMVSKYSLTHLKIIDDNFFVDINRVREVVRAFIERKMNISWDAECRCDYFNERILNDGTLKLLRDSGLVQLTIGIESGSPHSLNIMKKGITPGQAENAVKKCDQYGIIARSSFMLEVPGERIEDIKETIKFINRLRKYPNFTCGVGTFRPYPKCELTAQLIRQGYLKEPGNFQEWNDSKLVEMYTSAEHKRPWQVDSWYSESASYYLNMESAIRLGNHQIDNFVDRMKNLFFITAAKLRNRLSFYGCAWDKELYKLFLRGFYRKHQQLEKGGAYPVVKADNIEEREGL